MYPVESVLLGQSPERPILVDLGGGLGHQCIALRERFPQLKGRVILQDIPQTLAHAIPHNGVEVMVQDFFELQVIKGRVISSFFFSDLSVPNRPLYRAVTFADFLSIMAVSVGAKIYYMRNILHGYPDEKCRIILKNTIAALAKDSVILIDDMVLPDPGVHWQAAQLDMTMMTALASMERTKGHWYELLESAGLKINNIWTYTTSLRDSIIEAVPAE